MKTYLCPFCNSKVHGNHLKTCKQNINNLAIDETRLLYIQYNTYRNIQYDIIKDYNNLYSLTDLKKKYDLDFKNIQFILKYYNVNIRDLKTSALQITSNKVKKTCLQKYGVSNPSQTDIVKKKKCDTFIKHYGVDNIWKTEEYKQFTSDRWNSYTKEEKNKILSKWTRKHGSISNLEIRIIKLFKELNINIISQFKFKNYYHRYDIKVLNTNIIFEINGDFWHANPDIYKEDDILNFGSIKQNAKNIWQKDLNNINFAKEQNYIVYILWENYIISHTDNDIKKYILTLLN